MRDSGHVGEMFTWHLWIRHNAKTTVPTMYEANPPFDDALFVPKIEVGKEGHQGRGDREP